MGTEPPRGTGLSGGVSSGHRGGKDQPTEGPECQHEKCRSCHGQKEALVLKIPEKSGIWGHVAWKGAHRCCI